MDKEPHIFSFEGKHPDIGQDAYITPTVVLVGDVRVGARASIWFNTVARADINHIEIGEDSNIQDSCIIHVTKELPTIIKERVTVGHGAVMHGCIIESGCLIAMRAVILDGVIIGADSLIGAGAVVAPGTKVPPRSLVMGVPAKVVRELGDDEIASFQRNWRNYLGYCERYRQPGAFGQQR